MVENTKSKEILSNPLLLLIVGGIISGLLIPYITNQWQNHQKELEIKTDLLGRISESLAALLVARENMEIYLEGTRISNDTGDIFQNQFRDWSISSAVIGSELGAYFPQNQIGDKWDKFVIITNSFYAITAILPEHRDQHIQKIQQIISTDSNAQDLDVDGLAGQDNVRYINAKKTMEQYIINQKEDIMQDILYSNIPL